MNDSNENKTKRLNKPFSIKELAICYLKRTIDQFIKIWRCIQGVRDGKNWRCGEHWRMCLRWINSLKNYRLVKENDYPKKTQWSYQRFND